MSNLLSVILFSKDRPFQLDNYIRTFQKYAVGTYHLTVIFKSDPPYKAAYAELMSRYPAISWLDEDLNGGYLNSLTLSLEFQSLDLILFSTDDCLWYRQVNLPQIHRLLHTTELIGYSLRLSPDITFCQPANKINRLPKFFPLGSESLVFKVTDGDNDMAYPIEIGATIYRRKHIDELLQIALKSSPRNPNFLEEAMVLTRLRNLTYWPNGYSDWMACGLRPACSVLTVNRVQNNFCNAVINEQSTEALLELFGSSQTLDDEAYARKNYSQIHIGDWMLTTPKIKEDTKEGAD